MKPLSNNNLLDEFIKEQLKLSSLKLPSVDWNEIEVLLGAQKKPISFSFDKKIIKPFIIITIAIVVIFGIVKLIPILYNYIPKNTPEKNPVQETIITPTQPSAPITNNKIISSEIDSISLTEQKTDSMLKLADELSNKINGTGNSVVNKSETTNTVKKKKTSASTMADSLKIAADDIIIPPPMQDTTHIELNNTAPSTIPSVTDSATNSPDTKSKKSKRGKNRKSSSDSSNLEKTKPDSLK